MTLIYCVNCKLRLNLNLCVKDSFQNLKICELKSSNSMLNSLRCHLWKCISFFAKKYPLRIKRFENYPTFAPNNPIQLHYQDFMWVAVLQPIIMYCFCDLVEPFSAFIELLQSFAMLLEVLHYFWEPHSTIEWAPFSS